MFSKFFGSRRVEERIYSVPEDTRVYAIGDIHGRVDLLKRLHEMIQRDIQSRNARHNVLVYVGDYIDRGDSSRQVLDLLLDDPIRNAETVHLLAKLPEAHLEFLRSLRRYHVVGDYAFVHAGIRPGVALDEQVDEDVLWIRGEFLDSRDDHGKCIVHGHTITDEIDVQKNRIGIDTGAYYSGTLSCLVLDGESRAVLQT